MPLAAPTIPLPKPDRLRLLRGFLFFAAFVWGVSVFGVFMSWDAATLTLQGMGAKPIAYDRMLDYWLRMASGAFALVGVGYLMLALNPRKYAVMLVAAGWLMLLEGVVLAVHGFRLGLPAFPFYGDISACFVCGSAILVLQKSAR